MRLSIEGVAEARITAAFSIRPAHHRHVAGVVMDAVLLLVGGLVLLIDDDQAEIAVGQEQGRAGARHHLDVAGCDARIDPLALAAGDAGMPGRRLGAEAGLEAVEELRRQGDFRHQDQRLPALPHGFGDRLEINLRLARSGDAFQQGHAARIFAAQLAMSARAAARWASERPVWLKSGSGASAASLGRRAHSLERALVDKAVDDAGADARPHAPGRA